MSWSKISFLNEFGFERMHRSSASDQGVDPRWINFTRIISYVPIINLIAYGTFAGVYLINSPPSWDELRQKILTPRGARFTASILCVGTLFVFLDIGATLLKCYDSIIKKHSIAYIHPL